VDFELDAIVNSANEGLLGGGGIDEAIHKAAGPLLQRECASLNTLITKGYKLPATYVIHTTGPYLDENDKPQWDTLKRCYVGCLSLVEKYRLRSIALPPISSGFYGHPKVDCADVAVSTVLEWLSSNQYGQQIDTVVFAALDDDNLRAYRQAFAKHL
jgi:O-acetyl-ADP-ribose deacetylase (regulator of RNase III)